uniref:C3H1-type domain-containing protein n=1 Tax=Ascaris lumbricoides TaxID=6252 RepID=A0A0M3I4R1_ASCLU
MLDWIAKCQSYQIHDTHFHSFIEGAYDIPFQECLKEKIYSNEKARPRSEGVAMRGRGRCPHGPPVRCKNFPKCPGAKCYYFHGYCRYDTKCVKKECPFDHSDRPRICLSCLRDNRVQASNLPSKLRRSDLIVLHFRLLVNDEVLEDESGTAQSRDIC